VILVGEAPAADPTRRHLEVVLALRAAGKFPPGGRVLLARDLRWLHEKRPALFEFTARTEYVNLLDAWPGTGRKGSEFPHEAAFRAAFNLTCELWRSGPERVLLAGRRVARAFGISSFEYLSPVPQASSPMPEGIPVVVVPHPSGVNRWFNSPRDARQLRAFLEGLVR